MREGPRADVRAKPRHDLSPKLDVLSGGGRRERDGARQLKMASVGDAETGGMAGKGGGGLVKRSWGGGGGES